MSRSAPRPLVFVAVLVALALLAFGLARLVIGAAMLGTEMGWWSLGGEFTGALGDARRFLAEHAEGAIFPWGPRFYFALITAMGAVLSAGSFLYLRRRYAAGLGLIALYLALHGGMFLNYQLINPKIYLWGVTVGMWLILAWRARYR